MPKSRVPATTPLGQGEGRHMQETGGMAEKEQWPETGVSTVMYPRGKRERMCQEERMIKDVGLNWEK